MGSHPLEEAYRLFATGDLAGAERALGAILRAAPGDVGALNMLAGVKRAAGDSAGALALLEQAAQRAPQLAPLQLNLALALHEAGRHADAAPVFERAFALGARNAGAWRARGLSLVALERNEEAAACFREALALESNDADCWFNLGRALHGARRFEDAVHAYDEALRRAPQTAGVWSTRAAALHEADRLDEALESVERALALHPESADAHNNRGLLLFDLGRPAEAIASFDRALVLSEGAMAPARRASVLYNRGAAHLRLHQLEQGWPGFEQRWAAGMMDTPALDRGEPAWRGEPVGMLRVWREQGVGDEVLFARLVALAQARAQRVALQCDPRLAALFARSFAGAELVGAGDDAPHAEAQCALGSLGAAMQVGAGDLGGGAAFLRPDAARVATLRARYEALARGRPIIGIAWESKNPTRGALKSAALSEWGALLRREALFVSLQYGDVGAEIAAARAAFGCEIVVDAEVDQMRDLDAFAAQIAAMDRIVSVSNTTVHMAGALGVACIVMPPPARGRLWYWGVEGETTPWYASVRIVRRARDEDWRAQIARAAALL